MIVMIRFAAGGIICGGLNQVVWDLLFTYSKKERRKRIKKALSDYGITPEEIDKELNTKDS